MLNHDDAADRMNVVWEDRLHEGTAVGVAMLAHTDLAPGDEIFNHYYRGLQVTDGECGGHLFANWGMVLDERQGVHCVAIKFEGRRAGGGGGGGGVEVGDGLEFMLKRAPPTETTIPDDLMQLMLSVVEVESGTSQEDRMVAALRMLRGQLENVLEAYYGQEQGDATTQPGRCPAEAPPMPRRNPAAHIGLVICMNGRRVEPTPQASALRHRRRVRTDTTTDAYGRNHLRG